MKVYKNVSPFKQLESFAQDNWGVVGELMKYILNNDMKWEFNQHMNIRFKDGVGENDFKDYCLENANFIVKCLKKIASDGVLA